MKQKAEITGDTPIAELHRHSADYWAASTNSYFANSDFYMRQDLAMRDLLGRIGHVKSALDCGCSDGRYTFMIKDHADHVTGIDIAPALLEKARQTAASRVDSAGITFALDSVETMPVGDVFDLVACMGVTSGLIEDTAFLRAADALRAIVQPGGWLLLKDTLSTGEAQLAMHGDYVAMYRNVEFYVATFAQRGFAQVEEHILLDEPELHRTNRLRVMRLEHAK